MTESYGNDFFTITQYGPETVLGTAVPATKIWPGTTPKIVSDSKPSFPEESFNIRSKSRRAQLFETLYQNSLLAPIAGFQQLLLPLQCGLKGVTPTETTPDQDDWDWAFTPFLTPAAGPNAPKSATLEFTDGVQAYEVEYCQFDKITIKGTIPQDGGDASVSVEGSFYGRKLTPTTLTPALGEANATLMNAALARLYCDTAWPAGGTELANLLRSFEIQLLTGMHPVFRGSENTYFAAAREGILAASATFTIEGGSTAHALLAAQQAATFKTFRLKIPGPQIGTGVSHLAQFDIGGYLETVGPTDSADRGDNLATLGIRAAYDSVGAKLFDVKVITNQETV